MTPQLLLRRTARGIFSSPLSSCMALRVRRRANMVVAAPINPSPIPCAVRMCHLALGDPQRMFRPLPQALSIPRGAERAIRWIAARHEAEGDQAVSRIGGERARE